MKARIAALFAGILTSACTAMTTLYGVNSADDSLSVIDPDSAAVTVIGPLDGPVYMGRFGAPVSMAVRPLDGAIYVWGGRAGLGIVDRCSGIAAEIGPAALPSGSGPQTSGSGPQTPRTFGALAFAPDGRLFGFGYYMDGPTARYGLYELNIATGTPRYFGPVVALPSPLVGDIITGVDRYPMFGADFDANGNLYGISPRFFAGSQHNFLIKVNLTAATATVVGDVGGNIGTPGALVFDPSGRLLGSAFQSIASPPYNESFLFDIDKSTASVSNIRRLNGNAPQGMGFSFPRDDCTTPPAGSRRWKLVTSSYNHACALDTDGKAFCWGQNYTGQLGVGDASDHDVPAPVPPPSGSSSPLSFTTMSAGEAHNCGITAGGSTFCWGDNQSGELGNGTTSWPSGPVEVLGSHRFKEVSAGGQYTCALDDAGKAYCWGRGANGELGIGHPTDRSEVPVAVTPPYDGARFTLLTSGRAHSCGITETGDAYCWGRNEYGQLGDGNGGPGQQRNSPVAVTGGHKFKWLSAGSWHTCGITTSDQTLCWGASDFAGLESGSDCGLERCTRTPTAVPGHVRFAKVWAGATHTCGVNASGLAYCWGRGTSGELGTGELPNDCLPPRISEKCSYVPLPVFGGHVYESLAPGHGATTALRPDGTAYRWGGQSSVGSPLQPNDRPAMIPNPA